MARITDWNGRAILQDVGSYSGAIAYAEKIAFRAALNGNRKMADEYEDAARNLRNRQFAPIHHTKSGSF